MYKPPVKKPINNTRNSECGTSKLRFLDWTNWFQDNGYIHVAALSDETWHRVHPKPIAGYTCHRLAVHNGILFWLHDVTKPTTKQTKHD